MRVFLCPALMDLLAFLILFAVMYGAGERRMTNAQCAWLGGIFQLAYMVFSLAVGMLLTRRNTRGILHASTVMFIFTGILCLALKRFIPLLAALGMLGIVFAFFFNAFQAFMKGEASAGSLPRTVGFYTLAWSLGAALGMFSSGFFYRFGILTLSGLTAATGLVVLTILLKHRPGPAAGSRRAEELDHSAARPVNPAYVWIGWLIILTAMFVQRPICTFYPSLSAQAGISAFQAGIPLAIHMACQALAGLGMFPLRNLLYRKTSLWIFQGGAALVLLGIWHWPSLAGRIIGISLLGIYTGFAYFVAVFYASNSGRSAFNIGVNECLVGLGSFAGLFAVEGWMKRTGDLNAMYLIAGVGLLVSTALQLLIAGRRRKSA